MGELVEAYNDAKENKNTPTKTVNAVLRLPHLTRENIRRRGGMLFDPTFTRDIHRVIWNRDQRTLYLEEPLRADSKETGIKIFTGDTDTEDLTEATVVIQDMPFERIMALKRAPKGGDYLSNPVVDALTVDGDGGKWSFDEGCIQASALFYIEMLFAGTPFSMHIDKLSVKSIRDGFSSDKRKLKKLKDRRLLLISHIALNQWMSKYLTAVDKSPTSRPVTDRYYTQLMEAEISDQERARLGEILFGEVIFEELNQKRTEILASLRG